MVTLVAPAKVTTSLRVTGIRDDGYHLIDAEMITVDLNDTLMVTKGDALEVIETDSGLTVPASDDNLVRRALRLLGRTAAVRLHKAIPAGAGLGGGSADAAAILRWGGLTDPAIAASIGADVGFCLIGGRARVTGIGDEVEPLPFVPKTLTLVIPPFGVSTPAVYQRWDDMGGPVGDHGNDLEPAAVDLVPELARWRTRLNEACGQRPRLAGSGGTWFVDGAHEGLSIEGVVGRVVRSVPAE
jgi:4-diphosphocytidyl-2-C-methyl-D-erythritol kinase